MATFVAGSHVAFDVMTCGGSIAGLTWVTLRTTGFGHLRSSYKRCARMAVISRPFWVWLHFVCGTTSGRYSNTLSFCPSTLTTVFWVASTDRSVKVFHSPSFQGGWIDTKA